MMDENKWSGSNCQIIIIIIIIIGAGGGRGCCGSIKAIFIKTISEELIDNWKISLVWLLFDKIIFFCCIACFFFSLSLSHSSGSVTGLTWRTQRVGSVEIGKEHSLSSHRVQVGSFSGHLAKDPQVSPTHLWSKGHTENLTRKSRHRPHRAPFIKMLWTP